MFNKKPTEQRRLEALLRLMNIYTVRAQQTWRTDAARKAYSSVSILLNHAIDGNIDALDSIYRQDIEHMYVEP